MFTRSPNVKKIIRKNMNASWSDQIEMGPELW